MPEQHTQSMAYTDLEHTRTQACSRVLLLCPGLHVFARMLSHQATLQLLEGKLQFLVVHKLSIAIASHDAPAQQQ